MVEKRWAPARLFSFKSISAETHFFVIRGESQRLLKKCIFAERKNIHHHKRCARHGARAKSMKKKSTFVFRILCALWLIVSSVFVSAQEESNTLTDSTCHCRLLTNLYYGSFYGGSVDIYVGEDASGMFFDTLLIHVDFNHYGTTNYFVDLPLYRWIRIDYRGLKAIYEYVSGPDTIVEGMFALYDENDSVLCSGPEEFEGHILLWNACGLGIPDSVSDLSVNNQGNTVNLSWINPTQTVSGNPLAVIPRIEIRRNEQLIHTFTDVIAGDQMNYTDILPFEGTYQYSIQCFNEEGNGVPAAKHFLYGSNLTLFDYSHNVEYSDFSCSFSISSDNYYSKKGHSVLSFHRGDSNKMWSISGNVTLDTNVIVSVFAGEEDNLLKIEPDSNGLLIPHEMVTFVFDIPAGSSPEFHYTVECVNSLYEQPDTTIVIVPDSNGIIYVTQEGAGLRNGSSWSNATPWLNKALVAADTMSEKPMIWVAKGTYYGIPQMTDNDDAGYALNVEYAFLGRSGVNVYGGFAGNEPADYNLYLRNFEQNETILDGLLRHTVVNVGEAEWNGFHIQRGTNGCGMHENSTIRNCIISNCTNNGITRTQYQVGIIDSCSIIDNNGHGIAVGLTNFISNSLISRNAGDGIRSGGTVLNCVITQNGGGGFVATSWMGFSHIGVVNCLIANNGGDGVLLESNNYKVTNTTIVNNSGVGIRLGGIGHEVRNSIIYGNSNGSIYYPGYINISNFVLNNCAVEGNYLLSSHNNIPLASSIDTFGFHPDFASPTAGAGNSYGDGDWHLLPSSVCVNRGVTYSDYFPDTDLEGNPRIRQNTPDIGAYESDYSLHCEEGKIIYVKANGEGDGSTWSNAMSDLNHAIESAWGYGPNTRIWVAQGTYPTLGHPYYLKENLHLMGGFVGNEPADYDVNLRDPLTYSSVLEGQRQNRVLYQTIDFEHSALVEGFTLTHGQADEGAAAYLMHNTTLSKCRVVNNTATGNGSAVVTAVRDTLKQLLVENNDGTGIQAKSSQLLHCTVVRNNGDGIQLSGNTTQDSSLLYNSIAWGNAPLNLHFTSAMARQNTPILHCAIENHIVDGENNIVLSSNNGSESGPHFINPTDSVGVVINIGNWQIDLTSVCVNAGAELSDLYGIHTDLAGQPRMQNGKTDIGALESPYNSEVLCRNIEASIYEGENYLFYGNVLTAAGWYKHRWNVGEADSLVVLHLITKRVVYVSMAGNGSKDGSSWANALDGQTATTNGSTKLADALQTATTGTEFWIQSGIYQACSDFDVNKSLMLNEGISIYGAFAGVETAVPQRDTNNAPTVFSGNLQNDAVAEHYSRNIFKTNAQNNPNKPIILDNITITKGFNDDHSGTALHIYSSSTVNANCCRFHHHVGSAIANEGQFNGKYCALDSNVSNCVRGLSYEQYYDYQNYYEGAAAFTNKISGIAYFNQCAITYNQAPYNGAIFNIGEMTIDSSEVNYNKATEYFIGAIYNKGNLIILNTTLSYNQSYKFFSTVASFGSLIMRNCHVSNNQSHLENPTFYWYQEIWLAAYKSAHIMSDGVAEVSNCTFTHNSQNSGTDGGCLHISGKANIRHCDFINNIGSGYSHSFYGFWGDDNQHSSRSMIITTLSTVDNDGGGIHVENGNVYAENCLFDHQIGMSGTSASVRSGRLTLNACVFTRNLTDSPDDNSILTNRGGELIVTNSLFANNQNPIFNTTLTVNSTSIFTNCTFVNNESFLCHFRNPKIPSGCDPTWVNTDTAHVNFRNCIIVGDWGYDMSGISVCGDTYIYYPNFTVNFTNTLFDTLHDVTQVDEESVPNLRTSAKTINVLMDASSGMQTLTKADVQRLVADQPKENLVLRYNAEDHDIIMQPIKLMTKKQCYSGGNTSSNDGNASDCTPDSLGNIYYCDPMFVNPTTVMGVDSAQNPLLYDFRLQDGSPAINSGDTTGLHLTADATDLDGEQRVKRCQIDRGCYEYGTIVYDTVRETLCVEQDALSQLSYNGHGFNIAQLEVGENTFTRTCDCHPDANDSVQTLLLTVSLIQHSEFNAVACDSFEWHDETFTASGIYTRTFTDATGCDSIVTLHLTINSSNSSEFSESVCESFVWNNETFFISSDYTRTLTNAAGCDSLVILHLTVNHGTHNVETETACENYEWHGVTYTTSGIYTYEYTNATGCASADTLHLTVNHGTHNVETETACESYTWHGTEYTASGTYTYEYTNNSGCASIDTLHLTINFATSAQFTVTTADSCYIWNSQPYCTSGDYTQTLQTVDGCDSLVTLHLTITVGIDDHNLGAYMTVYPNPTTGVVNVQCTMNNGQAGAIEFQLFDAFGRVLRTTDGVGANNYSPLRTDAYGTSDAPGSSVQTAQIDLSHYAAGVYFVKAVANGNVVAVRKLIKN